MSDTLTGTPAKNYVGGDWRESASGESYEKRNPWRPSQVTGVYPASDAADGRAAVEAAGEAFPAWAALPTAQRAAYFDKAAGAIEARAEQIAQDMTAEMGKPLREARLEAMRAATILRFAAGEAWRPIGELYAPSVPSQRLYTLRRPLGVVALITPWNFPIAIPVWKLAPALIHGNAVVLKLAYEAPRTGLHVAECFAEAGLPAGVLNVLTGAGSKVGAELVRNPGRARDLVHRLRAGRPRGARRGDGPQLPRPARARRPEPARRDGRRGARPRCRGRLRRRLLVGRQKCTATRRILVQDAAYDDFRERLLARIGAGKVGDPADPEVEVGPVVNEDAMEEILAAIERARSDGTVLAGGERADDERLPDRADARRGLPDDAELSCEEMFGPVTSLYRFATFDEAIARANAVRFGLSAAIFTRDLRVVQRFSDEIGAGIIHVNSQTAGADVHVPFGGVKESGWGPHEQGRAAIEFYTETVTVYQDAPLA